MSIVSVVPSWLADRKFPPEPPSGKGIRVSELSGTAASSLVPLLRIVKLFRERYSNQSLARLTLNLLQRCDSDPSAEHDGSAKDGEVSGFKRLTKALSLSGKFTATRSNDSASSLLPPAGAWAKLPGGSVGRDPSPSSPSAGASFKLSPSFRAAANFTAAALAVRGPSPTPPLLPKPPSPRVQALQNLPRPQGEAPTLRGVSFKPALGTSDNTNV